MTALPEPHCACSGLRDCLMMNPYRTAEFELYLDEALPVEEMTRIEAALRDDPHLARRLAETHRRAGQRPDVAGRNLASASAELPKPARA